MKVLHVVTSKANIDNVDIVDGQILFLCDGDALYYDMDGVRRSVSGIKIVSELPRFGDESIIYIVGMQLYRYQAGQYFLMNNIDDDTVSDVTTYSSYKIEQIAEGLVSKDEKGRPEGVPVLDEDGYIPENELPAIAKAIVIVDDYYELPVVGSIDQIYVVKELDRIYRYNTVAQKYVELSLTPGYGADQAYPGDKGFEDHEAIVELQDNDVETAKRVQKLEDKTENLQLSTQSLQAQIDKISVNYLLTVSDITDLQSALTILHKDPYHNGDILVLVNTAGDESNSFMYDALLNRWVLFASKRIL